VLFPPVVTVGHALIKKKEKTNSYKGFLASFFAGMMKELEKG
jgi:hypothetical protein